MHVPHVETYVRVVRVVIHTLAWLLMSIHSRISEATLEDVLQPPPRFPGTKPSDDIDTAAQVYTLVPETAHAQHLKPDTLPNLKL